MDQYKVVKEIGKGGYGRALLVRSVKTGELKVVKEMNLSGMSAEARARALQEGEILGSLKHTNIIRYRNCTRVKSKMFILMDYADGGDLGKLIQSRKGKLIPEDVVLDYFVQVCLALKYLHDRKIIHRDLKPQNVFLAVGNIAKLGDFGISKTLEHTEDLAKSSVGTPFYCSPEICMGGGYDSKSDIWSLGCLLYEMLSLKRPFTGQNVGDIMRRVMTRTPAQLPIQYSKEIRDLTVRLLAKRPAERPSINEILQVQLIKNKAVALLGKTLAKLELSHSVFHGIKPGQSPEDGMDEVSWESETREPIDKAGKAGIYSEMRRMAQNLQQILQSENLVDVPREVEGLKSGEFYFMGRKLRLNGVTPNDPIQFKIECVRAFIEELVGADRVGQIYASALACDSEEWIMNVDLNDQSELYVFQLIMQLVAYENMLSEAGH
jgi:NIMA (never in mitosis gene a)-related kinase